MTKVEIFVTVKGLMVVKSRALTLTLYCYMTTRINIRVRLHVPLQYETVKRESRDDNRTTPDVHP